MKRRKYYVFLAHYAHARGDRVGAVAARNEAEACFLADTRGYYVVVAMLITPFAKWLLGVDRSKLPRPKEQKGWEDFAKSDRFNDWQRRYIPSTTSRLS